MKRWMDKVLPGLYIGNIFDAQDIHQLKANNITHIISLRSIPERLLMINRYLHIPVADSTYENIARYFCLCNDFIHRARLQNKNNNVLVHCYAGVSRSATIVIAYLMTVANLSWHRAWQVLDTVRPGVHPNMYFQDQLRRFQIFGLRGERQRLYRKFPSKKLEAWDLLRVHALLGIYERASQMSFSPMDCSKKSNKKSAQNDDIDVFQDCMCDDDIDRDGDDDNYCQDKYYDMFERL